jgi:hypothetical protein
LNAAKIPDSYLLSLLILLDGSCCALKFVSFGGFLTSED